MRDSLLSSSFLRLSAAAILDRSIDPVSLNPDPLLGFLVAIQKRQEQRNNNSTGKEAKENKSKLSINSIKFNDEMLAWAANENSKERFKSNEILWTLQCTEKYSKKIIDLFKNNKNYYLKEIAKEFENLIRFKVKDLIYKNIHGWR